MHRRRLCVDRGNPAACNTCETVEANSRAGSKDRPTANDHAKTEVWDEDEAGKAGVNPPSRLRQALSDIANSLCSRQEGCFIPSFYQPY